MWINENLCQVWGDGKNALPFVLVRDVAAALVRAIQVPRALTVDPTTSLTCLFSPLGITWRYYNAAQAQS